MGRIEERWLPWRLPVEQPVRAGRVELHHPVPDDLQRDPADPRRLRPACAIIDRRQREQTPRLCAVLRATGGAPHGEGVEIGTKRDRHGKPQSVCHLESGHAAAGKTSGVTVSEPWYNGFRSD